MKNDKQCKELLIKRKLLRKKIFKAEIICKDLRERYYLIIKENFTQNTL